MKRTKRFLALLLSLTVIAGCFMALPVSAAENTSTEDSSSFVYCDTQLKFDETVTEGTTLVVDESLFDGVFSVRTNNEVSGTGAYYYIMQDGALEFHAQKSGGKQAQVNFDVDLTRNHVMSWKVRTTSNNRAYSIKDGTSNVDVSGGYTASAFVLNTKDTDRWYTLVIEALEDGSGANVHFYKDNTWVCTKSYSGTKKTLNHFFYSVSGANTDVHVKMYYFVDYAAAEIPAFQIVGTPTATTATVQFNTPVYEPSLTGIAVGGNVATVTNVCATYDEPNVYQLTYDALEDNANYEIAVTGATGLPDSEGSATALTLQNQSFTLGTPKDPTEMTVYILKGFNEEPLAQDVEFVDGSDDNPLGWKVVRHLGVEGWNYSGGGRLLLKAPYKNNQNKRTQFNFNIDLTKNMIYDYRVTSPVWGCYVIDKDEDTGGPYVGNVDDNSPNAEASSVNSSTTVTNGGSTGGVTNRYTIMVDTEEQTVKYYLNGILAATETFEESETQKAYYHHFVNTKTGENEHQYSLSYYAEYEAAQNAKMKVLDVPDGKSVVVQFNQPVALETLEEGLTVTDEAGEPIAATFTATDASHTYDAPNAYNLTFSETLTLGTYTLAANVKGLSDSATTTDFGTVEFTIEPLTVEVKTLNGENYIQTNRALKLSGEEEEAVSTATYSLTEEREELKGAGLVKLPAATYGENAYQINSRNMSKDATWYITVNPVATDGMVADAVEYALTYTSDKLTFGAPEIGVGTVTVPVTNNRTGSVGFTFILAEYYTDASGNVTMTQAIMDKDMNVTAFSGTLNKTLSLTTPSEGEGYSYKAFIWNNLTEIKPLVD